MHYLLIICIGYQIYIFNIILWIKYEKLQLKHRIHHENKCHISYQIISSTVSAKSFIHFSLIFTAHFVVVEEIFAHLRTSGEADGSEIKKLAVRYGL